jgi:aminoglycoside phosphotransferase (APT) family kinase protein
MSANMPPAEVEITVDLVGGLLADQRPDLAGLDVCPIGFGWDNASFRVGDELVARMPRRLASVRLVENESRWLPSVAPSLPLPVSAPVFVGAPGRGYPWPWTLVRWIPGARAVDSSLIDLDRAATALAHFLRALHSPAPSDAPPNPYRGIDLVGRDVITRERIAELGGLIPSEAVVRSWEQALAVPRFDADPLWIHGDLHPANVLTVDRHISGVIDFGDITAGDPATDLSIAWMIFPASQRAAFRDAYGAIDEATWSRALGWALTLSIAYLANSADNETMRSIGEVTLGRALDDS